MGGGGQLGMLGWSAPVQEYQTGPGRVGNLNKGNSERASGA